MNQKPRLLCVDDEPNVLEGLKLHLRKRFEVTSAPGGEAGLEAIRAQGPFAAVISDMRMPGMDGATFLARVREVAPATVRLLLTGQTDISAAIAAVNQGQIFRFLSKPCPPAEILAAVEAAVEYHRLMTAEKVLLERTLHGTINALTEILSMSQPAAFGRAVRVKRLVGELAEHLNITERWPVEVAAMLSQIGCITLPPETVDKLYRGEDLDAEERRSAERLPSIAVGLIADIPRLEPVREILTELSRHFDNPAEPAGGRSGAAPSQEARMLRLALDFDVLEARGLTPTIALGTLQGRHGWYDPALLEAFAAMTGTSRARAEIVETRVTGLRSGMVLAEDVKLRSGGLLVARGQQVTESLIERLRNFSASKGIVEPLRVIVQAVAALSEV